MVRYDLLSVSTDPSHHAVVDPRFAYVLPDHEMAQGSTIGAPRCCLVVKPTGAIQKIYSPDAGCDFLGAVEVHFWDHRSGVRLGRLQGEFHIHPERQDHVYTLDNGVQVHEQLFPYNDRWTNAENLPPPAVYYRIHLKNAARSAVAFDLFAFAELRGNTEHDVEAEYDETLDGIVAWNHAKPDQLRLLTALQRIDGWEINADPAKAIARLSPLPLANAVAETGDAPIGVLGLKVELAPQEARWIEFLFVLASSREALASARRRCPSGEAASRQTSDYYWEHLKRSVVRTPDRDVNHGVLWAKANILRVQTYAPTGWCFTNDPTRSNNSVGRDTAWMSFGADYLNHHFARESLDAYFRLQQPCGKIVEFYDVRSGKSEDYGLNVNDNTPLAVIALWHHYQATGNDEYLRKRYPNAVRAMEYMLTQRDERGLIWCTATGNSDWGIVGWRNVIKNYRISGASTEVNSESYFGLIALAEMAQICGEPEAAQRYRQEAQALRDAINEHLVNPENDLYLLCLDVDGSRRTEVTADLVFPVLFGVAPPKRAARIVGALSDAAFWSDAGIRTVPRDALEYGPVNGYGLLGGVWAGVSYWFAFAAAQHEPQTMAAALAGTFRHFSIDPRRNNTVPGQFSEWLHGEILCNQGMMLSPWDAPRYLWAAIEGAAGLHVLAEPRIEPNLTGDWSWLTAINVPFRGTSLAWIACRLPQGVHLYTTAALPSNLPTTRFSHDVTTAARVGDPEATVVGFSGEGGSLIFVGNSGGRSSLTYAALGNLEGDSYAVRIFSTVWNEWEDRGRLRGAELADGLPLVVGAGGFALVEITP